ncbi:MAG TPA: V-type ATP synthase subunit D [Candidatus Dormibacteraeota bacterium]|nr:V-type ATP synthase subunit D [Candidatus Dormibacteraeota bacterium]
MRRIDVPATKSNLLRLKEHFAFIQGGHELLDQKREVLLGELIDIHRDAGQLRRQMEAELSDLYAVLRDALLAAGRSVLEDEALAVRDSQDLRVRERSVMGVVVPLLEPIIGEAVLPDAAPGWSPAGAAHVRRGVRRLLPAVVRLAEVEVSCRRLAAELQRTQRKVNALENVFIPQYRDTIRFIESALEEKEREALFHLKRLKSRRERGEVPATGEEVKDG